MTRVIFFWCNIGDTFTWDFCVVDIMADDNFSVSSGDDGGTIRLFGAQLFFI